MKSFMRIIWYLSNTSDHFDPTEGTVLAHTESLERELSPLEATGSN